jgi:hypothetical protein
MELLRSVAFFKGVVLGLAAIAVAGIVAFTYLFTGKLPSLATADDKPEVQLMTPEEMVVNLREQVAKARAAGTTEDAGGESDEPAQ